MRVLVIEDEFIIARNIKKYLEQHNFTVDISHDGETGYHYAKMKKYDCILLDLMLPGMDGMTLCKKIRQVWILTPVIMLTAKDTVDDKVQGLNTGADDYIIKPFSLHELTARIHALLRRNSTIKQKVNEIRCADLVCDIAGQSVKRWGKTIKLTKKEYQILHYLLLNKDTVVSKLDIEQHIRWHSDSVQSDVVRSHMQLVRKKIDSGSAHPLIHNIRGRGYILTDNDIIDED